VAPLGLREDGCTHALLDAAPLPSKLRKPHPDRLRPKRLTEVEAQQPLFLTLEVRELLAKVLNL